MPVRKHTRLITECMAHLRYKKQCEYVVSEYNKCDVIGIDKDTIYELEVKTTIADLKNELKKPKHKIYDSKSRKFKPTYFYIVIPEELVEKAEVWIRENLPHAGLMSYKPSTFKRYKINTNIKVKKRAKKLNSKKFTDKQMAALIKRIVSSMLQTKIKEIKNG
jgi:hypothetical protein